MTMTHDVSLDTADAVAVPEPAVDSPPRRSRRTYELCPWDLSELLPKPTEEVFSREIGRLEEAVESFELLRETLSPEMEPAEFLAVMRRYEDIMEMIDVVGGYSSLWFSSDTQSAAALSFRSHIRQVITQLHNRFLFFELWWKGLPDAQAERLLPDATTEVDLRHYLLELRRFKPYTLDERSEQIINTKDANGIDAVMILYSMLTNRLEFHPEIDGERQTLTEGEIRSQFYSPSAETRTAIYQELFRVYEQEAKVLAQIYVNRARDWHSEFVKLRGVAAPISVRNLRNDIPDAAVATLLEVVHANAPVFQEYFRLKGKWLGRDTMRRYDLYAPLAVSNQLIEYPDAVDSVLDTFRRFDDRIADLAEQVFAENHIDAEIRKGKRSGAFCATVVPRFTPWVHLNYAGRVRDVATIAHELGHAIHSMLANGHSSLTQHPSLPLAETSSVFCEMLMTDRLLARETDPVVRRELLAAAVDDVYATVMRQTYFVRFEIAAHQAILGNTSADELCDLYMENLAEQFGDCMEITPDFRYEWLGIPHMYSTPFYCYAYSFAQLLVLALYRRYQEEGEAFMPGYLRLLSYGGAARPAEILGEIGIDITDAAFWQGGFDVVRGMLDELKSIEIP